MILLNIGAKMVLQFKIFNLSLLAGFILLSMQAVAQPGMPGPPPGMPGSDGPRQSGPYGPSSRSPVSPYSGPGSQSFSTGPRGGSPDTAPRSQSQPTRFGSIPDSPANSGRQQNGFPSFPNSGRSPGMQGSSGPSPADTAKMQQALHQRDYQAIGEENRGVRNRAKEIQDLGPGMPVQDRIKLPLIGQMYRQGADMVDDGRTRQDESKIRVGIQQINEANEKLDHLKGSMDRHSPGPYGPQQQAGPRPGR